MHCVLLGVRSCCDTNWLLQGKYRADFEAQCGHQKVISLFCELFCGVSATPIQ